MSTTPRDRKRSIAPSLAPQEGFSEIPVLSVFGLTADVVDQRLENQTSVQDVGNVAG